MSTEPETHTGKAGVEHARNHCRPRWCGEFPPEGHPLAATPEDLAALAAGHNPVHVYNGAYRGLATEQANARIGVYGNHPGTELPDGTDTFQHLQKPDLHPAGDPLAAFVKARIIDAELEPRHEFPRVYGLEAGPIAHRYAKHMRADCVVFRRIVASYLEAKAASVEIEDEEDGLAAWHRRVGLFVALTAIANRWSDHPEFRDEWRLA